MKSILYAAILLSSLVAKTSLDDIKCDQIIKKLFGKICYDYKLKSPKWVLYNLDKKLLQIDNVKKRQAYREDMQIPTIYRTVYSDYSWTKYMRSFGANSEDFRYDESILMETYSMTNIVPQYPRVNKGIWQKIEAFEKELVESKGNAKITTIMHFDKPKYLERMDIEDAKKYRPYARWEKDGMSDIYISRAKILKSKGIAIPTSFTKIININNSLYCFNVPNNEDVYLHKVLRRYRIRCNKVRFN